MNFDNMLNKKISFVRLENDGNNIVFKFLDGTTRRFGVDGDCCSSSWIEHLELPKDVEGATLLSVEEGGAVTQDHDEHDKDENGYDKDSCISVYNTIFTTDRGDIVLEYRNASNGYYGGYLTDEPARN